MSDTHRLTRGKLSRVPVDHQGVRLRDPETDKPLSRQVLVLGDTFTPTSQELRAFSDRLQLIHTEAPPKSGAPSAPEKTRDSKDEELEAVSDALNSMNVQSVLAAVDSGELEAEKVREAEMAGQGRKGVLKGIAERQAGAAKK